MKNIALELLAKIESSKPFTEPEAWGLFRIAALSEAVGWTILITGIIIRKYGLPGHDIAVPIAGRVHGTIFLAYFGILIATYSSSGWPRKKFLIAILAGIPPYGTLVFEQWASRARKRKHARIQSYSLALSIITGRL